MDHSKIETLESLLRECVPFVTVRSRTGDPIDGPTYRTELEKVSAVYAPESRRTISGFVPQVEQPEVRAEVLDFIKDELMNYLHEDLIYPATGVVKRGISYGATIDDVLRSLLRRAIVYGERIAAQEFSEWINSSSCAFGQYLAIVGLQVEREVEVFDGIWLVPLVNSRDQLPPSLPDDMFSVFLRHPGEVDIGRPWVRTLLRIDLGASPAFLMSPDAGNDSVDVTVMSKEVPDFDVEAFLDALSLCCQRPIQEVGRWLELMEPYQTFDLDSLMGPTSVQWRVRGDFKHDSYRLVDTDIEALKRLYADVVRLDQKTRTALQVPITRWKTSMEQDDDIDSMIDLGIAFESLYLREENAELSFRFQLRAAWYLGTDPADREALIQEFAQIYACRSKAVHGGQLGSSVRVAGRSVATTEFIQRSQDLCLQSIKKVIYEGRLPDSTDWRSMVLGGKGNVR